MINTGASGKRFGCTHTAKAVEFWSVELNDFKMSRQRDRDIGSVSEGAVEWLSLSFLIYCNFYY